MHWIHGTTFMLFTLGLPIGGPAGSVKSISAFGRASFVQRQRYAGAGTLRKYTHRTREHRLQRTVQVG
jgi:hypothetical protein